MPYAAPPPIHTERLTLRLVEPRDLADLLEVHRVDEVTRFLPYATWTAMADAEAWYQRTAARQAEGSAMQFVMADRRSSQVVGSCLLFHFDEANGRAELGYVLGRPHWGRGMMHEALCGLLGAAFGTMGVRRLEAEVDPRNGASHAVLMRLGFTKEGLLRQRWVAKGEVKDAHIYGLLRSDWRDRSPTRTRTTERDT